MTTTFTIVKCNPNTLRNFWMYPYLHYKNHPIWVPPLRMDQRHKYTIAKNPFFKHAKAAFWMAFEYKKPVGRIAAFVNHLHLEKYADQQGHFGCFEAKNEIAAKRLLDAAATWLTEQGMASMTGPYDFSINEMSGLLIDGFDKQPFIMMPYNTADYPRWFDHYGLEKEKDVFAYTINPQNEFPEKIQKLVALSKRMFPVTIRALDKTNLTGEIQAIFEIFNAAWTHNWGSIPMTSDEITHAVSSMKPIAIPDAGCFAYVENSLVGMLSAIPNINGLIQKYNGRLFPFNFLHLLYCIKTMRIPSYRVCLGGVIPRYVETKTSALIFIQLVDELLNKVKHYPQVTEIELSWILEDNINLISLIEAFGASRDKVYRLYSKPL